MAMLEPPSSRQDRSWPTQSQSPPPAFAGSMFAHAGSLAHPAGTGHHAMRFREVQFAPDHEKRQSRRRGLRCTMLLSENKAGSDVRPKTIPAHCCNVSDTGLYCLVPVGYGVRKGQRYTFQLNLTEPGPESANYQIVTQQGVIVRTESLISAEGRSEQLGIGVRLVGLRCGLVPMPEHL